MFRAEKDFFLNAVCLFILLHICMEKWECISRIDRILFFFEDSMTFTWFSSDELKGHQNHQCYYSMSV